MEKTEYLKQLKELEKKENEQMKTNKQKQKEMEEQKEIETASFILPNKNEAGKKLKLNVVLDKIFYKDKEKIKKFLSGYNLSVPSSFTRDFEDFFKTYYVINDSATEEEKIDNEKLLDSLGYVIKFKNDSFEFSKKSKIKDSKLSSKKYDDEKTLEYNGLEAARISEKSLKRIIDNAYESTDNEYEDGEKIYDKKEIREMKYGEFKKQFKDNAPFYGLED
jgi:hypothetical protein